MSCWSCSELACRIRSLLNYGHGCETGKIKLEFMEHQGTLQGKARHEHFKLWAWSN